MSTLLILPHESVTCSICYDILDHPVECKSCHNLFSKKDPIYFWKGNCFYIERIDSNYLNLLKKEEDSFEIGTDSLGKKLYFYSKVINFIEITDSSEPSIDKIYFLLLLKK